MICDLSGWSAPSAIGIAGLGGGLELGAEVRILLYVLLVKYCFMGYTACQALNKTQGYIYIIW